MIVNSIDKIKPDSGRYVLLTDLGTEGLHVVSQHYNVEDCIAAMSKSPWTSHAILELVSITTTPR